VEKGYIRFCCRGSNAGRTVCSQSLYRGWKQTLNLFQAVATPTLAYRTSEGQGTEAAEIEIPEEGGGADLRSKLIQIWGSPLGGRHLVGRWRHSSCSSKMATEAPVRHAAHFVGWAREFA
jgi:hypothetical protein